MKEKIGRVIFIIVIILYLIFIVFLVGDEIKTYDTMNVDERIRTEQSIIPGWWRN